MKNPFMNTFLVALLVWVSGCDKKQNDSPQALLAGTTSKVWRATKETNSEGDREKMSAEEKKDMMQFYANGNFSINSSTQSGNGTWTSDAAAKTLTLQYAGAGVSETFQILEIDEDDLKLKAADGSELTLKTE